MSDLICIRAFIKDIAIIYQTIILKFIFKLDRSNVEITILVKYGYISQKPRFSKNPLSLFKFWEVL